MKRIIFFLIIFLLLNIRVFAQKVGEVEKLEREIERERILRERIEKKRNPRD
jgi:hypothetical protein